MRLNGIIFRFPLCSQSFEYRSTHEVAKIGRGRIDLSIHNKGISDIRSDIEERTGKSWKTQIQAPDQLDLNTRGCKYKKVVLKETSNEVVALEE